MPKPEPQGLLVGTRHPDTEHLIDSSRLAIGFRVVMEVPEAA